ncbi:hypothetical protein [Cellulomonas sp.]|uniref:hypothetical protein n=1 Tax=Cellulomonas sp. TaxID=40001 RepID=UPI001B132FF3|nr:hypothetical protein [Cellulomonas sp.]MBO9554332.1 hypothetical protein [Cellulomonas sp.]
MTATSVAAAANNAAWCDLVCRAAGLPTVTRPDLWSTPRRSPDAYPDAVTLRAGVRATDVLAAVDSSPGASVKDSFADLDLTPHGFTLLFSALWITRAAPSGRPTRTVLTWRVVDAATLPTWAAVHGPTAVGAAVLDDPAVRLLIATDAHGPLAVAALNRSGTGAGTVVGVSNVRVLRADAVTVWSDLQVVARRELGPLPLVGYESGDDLDAPRAIGFEPAGPLRVWTR